MLCTYTATIAAEYDAKLLQAGVIFVPDHAAQFGLKNPV